MAFERIWAAIPPAQFISQGTKQGIATIVSTEGFKVDMDVMLKHPTLSALQLRVKEVISATRLVLGPRDNSDNFTDVSQYDTQALIQAFEQDRPNIPLTQVQGASYEEAPTCAERALLVDWLGDHYSVKNPVPVRLSDGNINVENLNADLRVQLSSKDNDPTAGDVHSSVRIGDENYEVAVNPDGSINTNGYERYFALLSNANFLKSANFDQILPSVSGNVASLNYYEDSALIATASIMFVNSNSWSFSLQAFLNDDDGSVFLDDDGTNLLLE